MPGLNYSIKVNKEDEKRLYRIMKELEFNGESFVVDVRGPDWQSTMRKFGVRAKPLIEKDLIEPIWVQYTSDKTLHNNRLIRKKKSVSVEEVSKGKISTFYFKPINIDELHVKRRKLI